MRCGDRFVESASLIAESSGIPPFVIGATVVSFATTLPELLVSVIAAASGQLAMSAGNAIGSVTANTALILALSLIFMPGKINRRELLPKAVLLILSIAVLWAVTVKGRLKGFGIIALMILFSVYVYENLRSAKKKRLSRPETGEKKESKPAWRLFISFLIGAGGIILGSRLLIDNGTVIARDVLHIDERVIALTLVAVGTSLPELVTTIGAIVKRRGALAVGNIIGANTIDMLLIFPICALVRGGTLPISGATVWLDLPVSFIAALITLVPALITGRMRRWQGICALVLYVFYLFILFIK